MDTNASVEWDSTGWLRFMPRSVWLAITMATGGVSPAHVLGEHWLESELQGVSEAIALVDARESEADEELQFAARALGEVRARWMGEGWSTVADALRSFQARGWLDDDFRWIPTAPLPAEALELTPDQVGAEDEFRWTDRFYPLAQRIIARLFDPNGRRTDVMTTSLAEIGGLLDVERESAREALGVLVGEGDFRVSCDLSTVAPDERFEIAVDWDLFESNRLSIGLGSADDAD